MLGCRVAHRGNTVGDAHPAGGADRQHRHTPVEPGIAGHRRQVVGAGLKERHPAGKKLVTGEVTVVVGVRGRWRDVIVVDQTDQVTEGLDRCGVVERELIAALKYAAGRPDVVEVDGLSVVTRVVSPLTYPCGVETRSACEMPVCIDGEPGQ